MSRRAVITGLLLLALAAVPRAANASIILGGQLFVQQDGDVVAKYLGDFADFTSGLFLAPFIGDPEDPLNFGQYIFINNGEKGNPGDTVNLGFFPAGTELIFGLYVSDTANTFFTGPASRNFDDLEHALVIDDPFNDLAEPPPPPFPAGALAFLVSQGLALGDVVVGFEDKDLFTLLQLQEQADWNDLIFAFSNVGVENPVPEPATLLLFGSGIAGFMARRRLIRTKR